MCNCIKQTLFLVGFVGIALVAPYFWRSRVREPASAAKATSETVAAQTAATIAVYYFHGTIRCQKCLEVEKISREAVESFYADELSDGRFRWQSVDFDLPENRHYLNEFNLGLPSLAVECRTQGGISRIVLSNTWEKVGVPEDLEDYVITGIEAFRDGAELPGVRPVTL